MITTALSPFLSCRVKCTHTHKRVWESIDSKSNGHSRRRCPTEWLESNPVLLLCSKNFSCPNSSLSGKNTQEVSIKPLSFYMSFELDSCSLRDVIVIGCVRKPPFSLSLYLSSSCVWPHRNKCSIITPTRKGEKTNALAFKPIRSFPPPTPHTYFALRKERKIVGNARREHLRTPRAFHVDCIICIITIIISEL